MSKVFFTSDTHFNQQRTFDFSMRKMYFVDVDVHNFTPVDMETIEFYRNAIQNHFDYNCFDNF